jgi:hypothetical protein
MSDEALARLSALEAKVDALLRLQEAAHEARRPNLTITEFAKLAGKSRWTIQQYVRQGKIRRIGMRIPRDQLRTYIS